MDEWKDIETAPKNGRFLAIDIFGDIGVASTTFDETSTTQTVDYPLCRWGDLTHWMPLPRPLKPLKRKHRCENSEYRCQEDDEGNLVVYKGKSIFTVKYCFICGQEMKGKN